MKIEYMYEILKQQVLFCQVVGAAHILYVSSSSLHEYANARHMIYDNHMLDIWYT